MALKKGINVRHGMQFGEPGATSASELAYDANTTTKEKIDALATTVAGKQNALTFDDVPTDNSNNPVKSNGVYDALATKQGKPTEITYADWQLLTPQQQETGNWLVTGVPGSSLSIRVTALEQNKQDKTDNTLTTNSKQTTGAINELNSNLTNGLATEILNATTWLEPETGVNVDGNLTTAIRFGNIVVLNVVFTLSDAVSALTDLFRIAKLSLRTKVQQHIVDNGFSYTVKPQTGNFKVTTIEGMEAGTHAIRLIYLV